MAGAQAHSTGPHGARDVRVCRWCTGVTERCLQSAKTAYGADSHLLRPASHAQEIRPPAAKPDCTLHPSDQGRYSSVMP